MAKAKALADPSALKRVEAGSYRSGDGRFHVEQASGRWLVTDEEQHDELGLPLVRGPFATLDEAREAIAAARSGPAPTSELARRTSKPAGAPGPARATAGHPGRRADGRSRATSTERPREPEPIEVRRYTGGDGEAMRSLWASCGMRSIGDDDAGLDLLAERNAGLVLVATQGSRIVGTALGAWDGRRGWIYHLAIAEDHRRSGLGRRLVHEVERKLRALGCPKVEVVVRDGNEPAAAFWRALGYEVIRSRLHGREL